MGLTPDIVAASTGSTLMRASQWCAALDQTCRLYGINTRLRQSAFLAQLGHESGRLVYVREIWGPTPAQQRYEGRRDLGNTEPGDGKRFLGRGLIQVTGRANYSRATAGLRKVRPDAPDFVANPTELEKTEWAALSAGWYWDSRSINDLADKGDFIGVTRKINGGTNGLADRQALYDRALKAIK